MYAQVAPLYPIQPLTYSVPEDLIPYLKIGSPVQVTLKNKKISGYIVALKKECSSGEFKIKSISAQATDLPYLPEEHIAYVQWIADYYHYPIGEVISSLLPPHPILPQKKVFSPLPRAQKRTDEDEKTLNFRDGKRRKLLENIINNPHEKIDPTFKSALLWLIKNEFIGEKKETVQAKFLFPQTNGAPISEKKISPNEEQVTAINKIRDCIFEKKFSAILLEGITGSGKTEVYLSAAEYVKAMGGSIIFMVPEISLTPQLLTRVRERLGNEVAVLHSSLTDRERSEQWHLVQSGKAKILLGARSAILAPMQNLRLIIVDEEHEAAFKQEDRLRYNARDLALVRAKQSGACVVLGSATPSLESFHNALSGKYVHLQLNKRISGATLPKIQVVNLVREAPIGLFSPTLIKKIKETLAENKQVLLFLNRKGFSSYVFCEACGHVPMCPNCSVSLTHYQRKNSLECHYCAYQIDHIANCKECGSPKIDFGTKGTENLEEQTHSLFPDAKIIRIDRDKIDKQSDLENIFKDISIGKFNIIIGTQMMAKGHDFPDLRLVAVMNADASFNIPDFRASEKSYQLFTQVAGRAGRSDFHGHVIFQTYNPEHPCIRMAQNQNFHEFAKTELEARKAFHYPPFYRLIRILVSSPKAAESSKWIEGIAQDIKKFSNNQLEMIGPAPAVMEKIQNKYRWHLLLKSTNTAALHQLILSAEPRWRVKLPNTCHLQIDVDPSSLL